MAEPLTENVNEGMKRPNHWEAIYGSFNFEPGKVIFPGGTVPNRGQESVPADGLAMSDITYSGGTITALAKYQDAKRIPSIQIVLFRNPFDNSIITAGLEGELPRPLKGRYAINVFDARERNIDIRAGFRALHSTAFVTFPASREIQLKVVSLGS